MRRGEILALRWEDLVQCEDEDDHIYWVLVVRNALSQYTGTTMEKRTKTDRIRTVEIDDDLAALLLVHRKTAARSADGDFIFTNDQGKPLAPKRFSEAFLRIRTSLSMECTLHGLRHTHVTELLRAGVPDHIVSFRVGHSTVAFTKDRYAHVLPSMQQRAVKVTNDLLKRKEE